MKRLLSTLMLCAVALSLASCLEVPGRAPGYAAPRPAYEPAYAPAPAPYYGSSYDRGRDHHDDYNQRPSSNSGNRSYYGGPAEWYKSGYALGAQDRRRHVKADYHRHNTQYDGKTKGEFARGYDDGYRRG